MVIQNKETENLKGYIENHTYFVYKNFEGEYEATQFPFNPQQKYFEVIAVDEADAIATVKKEIENV